ncbi:hypothetical protein [Frischella perrara]|uniref:hypothetical protein n=1 Tax=Frischella perrara TaxID=1267021 RepID=UPI0023F24103|nr:hypothetical protein [Frischella perrara]
MKDLNDVCDEHSQKNNTSKTTIPTIPETTYYARRLLLVLLIIIIIGLTLSIYTLYYMNYGKVNVLVMIIAMLSVAIQFKRKFIVINETSITIYGAKCEIYLFSNLIDFSVKKKSLLINYRANGIDNELINKKTIKLDRMLSKDRKSMLKQLQMALDQFRQSKESI